MIIKFAECDRYNIERFNFAFTLAEVLITLAVIGIVAAVTLPAAINKINDIQYDRAREKALATIGEAGRLLSVKGYMNSASNAETLVKNYLSENLKITKMCDADNLDQCGLPKIFKKLDNTEMDMPKTLKQLNVLTEVTIGRKIHFVRSNPSYGILLSNGYSVNLFYNQYCTKAKIGGDDYAATEYVCINAIYDMNGLRGPNKIGKDLGIVTILYPDETTVAVAPNPNYIHAGIKTWAVGQSSCPKGYRVTTMEELLALTYNNKIFTELNNGYNWTSSLDKTDFSKALFINGAYGYILSYSKGGGCNIFCIKN